MSQNPSSDGLSSKRRKASIASRAASGIDIGQDPPLNAAEGGESPLDRREINLRWLGASVLTGLTGAALIGASIHVALQGAMTPIAYPEKAVAGVDRSESPGDRPVTVARKGDRLIRSDTGTAARQSFRAPMTIRSGEREAIKVRHFVRIATNLSLSTGTYATDIPPFNPMRLFAEDAGERYVEQAPVEIADADVAVVRSDLSAALVDPGAPSLNDDDVISILEEERRVSNDTRRQTAVPIPAQQMLSRTLRSPDGFGDALGYARIIDAPFSSIEVRVVPENVTALSKPDQTAASPIVEERELVLKKGETLETVLRSYGANPEQIQAITTALGATVKVATLPDGERIRILIAPGPRLGDARQIVRVILIGDRGIEATAATNDRGLFVSVTPPADDKETASRLAGGGARG